MTLHRPHRINNPMDGFDIAKRYKRQQNKISRNKQNKDNRTRVSIYISTKKKKFMKKKNKRTNERKTGREKENNKRPTKYTQEIKILLRNKTTILNDF